MKAVMRVAMKSESAPRRRYPCPHSTHRRQDTVRLLLLIFTAGLTIIIIIRESSINTNTIWDNKAPINSEGNRSGPPPSLLPLSRNARPPRIYLHCKSNNTQTPFSYPLDCLPYPLPLSTNTWPVSNIRCTIKRLNHLNFKYF